MTNRSRAAAERARRQAAGADVLLCRDELEQRRGRGERVILVDVRTEEEQRVSMLPGALGREVFEAEVLPSLRQPWPPSEPLLEEQDVADAPLIVPYCTVGYFSRRYCDELIRRHGVQHVRNGGGVITWAFEGGSFVRPNSDAEPPFRAPALPLALLEQAREGNPVEAWQAGSRALPKPSRACTEVDGNPAALSYGAPTTQPLGHDSSAMSSASKDDCVPLESIKEMHVYKKLWDIAPEGYTTVYYSVGQLILLTARSHAFLLQQLALVIITMLVFYLFFTPMCGVMYRCGCVVALSKWGQVRSCNIYDSDTLQVSDEPSAGGGSGAGFGGGADAAPAGSVHRCPWCSCTGLACLFVGADGKAFHGVPLFDLCPDGTVLTMITLSVVCSAWRPVDRLSDRLKLHIVLVVAIKVFILLVWFFSYSLALGALFYLFRTDYPYFLGFDRSAPEDESVGDWEGAGGGPGRRLGSDVSY